MVAGPGYQSRRAEAGDRSSRPEHATPSPRESHHRCLPLRPGVRYTCSWEPGRIAVPRMRSTTRRRARAKASNQAGTTAHDETLCGMWQTNSRKEKDEKVLLSEVPSFIGPPPG